MAAEGYPGSVERGRRITGLAAAAAVPGVQVFHAATTFGDAAEAAEKPVLADGGRVLAVTALGPSLARAKLQAYTAVKEIRWPGAWCRKDISDKGLRQERALLAAAGDATEPASAQEAAS